jgi:phosphatidylserine synthase
MFNDNFFANFFTWWIAMAILGAVGFLLFYVNPSVEFKKKYTHAWIIISGIAVVVFAFGIGFPITLLVFLVIPLATLVIIFNFKTARICGNCGRYNQKLSSEKVHCRDCGAEITD